jgi:subtilase family serine protease
MKGFRLLVLAALAAGSCVVSPAGSGANGNADYHAVCPGAEALAARCHASVVTDARGNPDATTSPTGYGPAQFLGAYSLSGLASGLKTVTIVDAYDNPTIRNDLSVYSNTMGIADLPTCTSPADARACFIKVNQSGGTSSFPRKDAGWALEIALDVEVAHAVCQNCKIILVEGSSNQFVDLGAAVNTAANLGANVISNSYGGSEFSQESTSTYGGFFNHPGIAITVSSGDSGYGVEFPAASRYVTAVGGTHLVKSATARGWTETVWNGAGSGCSAYITKPSFQSTIAGVSCSRRMVADVSAVADPNTGVSVYDTYRLHPGGWLVFGGTSVSAPIIAAVYALAGNTASITANAYPYSHTSSLFDVTSGSNGNCGTFLCTARAGWDGPTGLGTPNGTGAF